MLQNNMRLLHTKVTGHTITLWLCKNNKTRHKTVVLSIKQNVSVQKCEHRIGIYHLLQYRTATQDIEKHYNVINQYNIIEHTAEL